MHDVPFWKPFSQSVFITIQQNNKAPEFIKLRDAILKFSAQHDDLTRLEIQYKPYKVQENADGAKGQGSTSWFRSFAPSGFSLTGLI